MAEAKRLADAGLGGSPADLLARVTELEGRVRQAEERRRALLHIMGDLNDSNKRLGQQRKAMLHILEDSHQSNLRLEASRKAMIHIMGDLRETTAEMERREHELREKQEQLVQAGKLATLGELTTGVAHELNNPLNNIGLFVGNVLDQVRFGHLEKESIEHELENAMEQVRKATAIISHLRTFGRPAAVSLDAVDVDEVIERSLSLMLEQLFINLLTNARDALAKSRGKTIRIATSREDEWIKIRFADTGPGIPRELEQRVFDPFFTTKEVGTGTGLGLSITYSIVKEHGGTISVEPGGGRGARFLIELPVMTEPPPKEPL